LIFDICLEEVRYANIRFWDCKDASWQETV